MQSDAEVTHRELVYGTAGTVRLRLHVFAPPGPVGAKRAGIVFFFGGGWTQGHPKQFFPHCTYLAGRGMVGMSAEYRIRNRHRVSPFQCVGDAKAAIRWIRAHAGELGVDPNRLAAGGGSAGGLLAARAALGEGLDDPEEPYPNLSARPDALALFNPPVDFLCAQQDRVREHFGEHADDASPYQRIGPGAPPTVIFHGDADDVVPLETIRRFEAEMKRHGNDCRVHVFAGYDHGFFNEMRPDKRPYHETVRLLDGFLTELGYLEPAPVAATEAGA